MNSSFPVRPPPTLPSVLERRPGSELHTHTHAQRRRVMWSQPLFDESRPNGLFRQYNPSPRSLIDYQHRWSIVRVKDRLPTSSISNCQPLPFDFPPFPAFPWLDTDAEKWLSVSHFKHCRRNWRKIEDHWKNFSFCLKKVNDAPLSKASS